MSNIHHNNNKKYQMFLLNCFFSLFRVKTPVLIQHIKVPDMKPNWIKFSKLLIFITAHSKLPARIFEVISELQLKFEMHVKSNLIQLIPLNK